MPSFRTPGKMRWRVQLQQYVATPDDYGQPIKGWSTIGTYWAEIWSVAGRENVNAAQMKGEVTHQVTIRYLGTETPVDPKMRLLFASRVFNIIWVNNPDERNRWLELSCQEVDAPP